MLGIDVGQDAITVVNVRRRGGHFVLHGPLRVSFTAEQAGDASALGGLVGTAMREAGWRTQKAVVTLPSQFCLARYFSNGALGPVTWGHGGHLSRSSTEHLLDRVRRTMLVDSEELVFDLWSGPEGMLHGESFSGDGGGVLVAAVHRRAVEFGKELAAASGVKLDGLELRSLASVNGLLFHWQDVPESHLAVVYLEGSRAEVGVLDDGELVSLQTVPLSGGSARGAIAGDEELLGHLSRVLNTVRLSQGRELPERVFLAGGDERSQGGLERVGAELKERLGVEVTVCAPGWGLQGGERHEAGDLLRLVPAVGAALDGLGESPTWFNFLHTRVGRAERKHQISWRPFALVGLLSVLLTGAFWLSLVQQKHQKLVRLEDRMAKDLPRLEATRDARKHWNEFRGYLPASRGGARRSYLYILGEISRLFPDRDAAYVSDLLVEDTPGLMGGYNVTIKGKVSEPTVLTALVTRLNESAMFYEVSQATSRVETNPHYRYGFTVQCNLRPVSLGGAEDE